MICSHFRVIACQSTIKGMSRNMSLLKTKLPGLLPRVVCILALIACIAMDSASSTNSFAVVMFVVVHYVIEFLGHCPLFGAFFHIWHLLVYSLC